MDPVTAITSTVGIIGAVAGAYETIKKIQDLPKAFDEVNKTLPLVQGVLGRVEGKCRMVVFANDENSKSILSAIKTCHDKAEQLQKIFDTLERKCKDRDAEKTWKRARAWYREAMRGMQADRVEGLMKEILDRMRILAMSRVFSLNDDLDEIKEAINSLSKVEPSLKDENDGGSINASLTTHDNSKGSQINQQNRNEGKQAGHQFIGDGHSISYISHVYPRRSKFRGLPSKTGFKSHDISPPTYHIPIEKTPSFVGRTEILKTLKETLPLGGCKKHALLGLGGIGKSEIALHLAHWVRDNKQDYSVFWTSASSENEFDTAYGEVAHQVGLPTSDGIDYKEELRLHLSSVAAGFWLLIVDKLDDEDVYTGALQKLLPTTGNGLILFTTRSPKVASLVAGENTNTVPAMSQDEGMDFFGKAMKERPFEDPEIVLDLLKELAFLPMAIRHAINHLKRSGVSVKDHLSSMRRSEENMVKTMRRKFPGQIGFGLEETSIANTWVASFNQIQKQSGSAAKLLRLLSMYGREELSPSILPVTKKDFYEAAATLAAYGFITFQGNGNTFDMHRLVFRAARLWIRRRYRNDEVEEAVMLFSEKLGEENLNRQTSKDMAHPIEVLKACEEVKLCTEPVARLRLQVGCLLLLKKKFEKAASMLDIAVEIMQQKKQDLLHLACCICRCEAYGRLGPRKEEDTIRFTEEIVTGLKEATIDRNKNILYLRCWAARLCLIHGLPVKGRGLAKGVVSECKSPEDDEYLIDSQITIAEADRGFGKADVAIQNLTKLILIQEEALDNITSSKDVSKQTTEASNEKLRLRRLWLSRTHYALAEARRTCEEFGTTAAMLEKVVNGYKHITEGESCDSMLAKDTLKKARSNLRVFQKTLHLLKQAAEVKSDPRYRDDVTDLAHRMSQTWSGQPEDSSKAEKRS